MTTADAGTAIAASEVLPPSSMLPKDTSVATVEDGGGPRVAKGAVKDGQSGMSPIQFSLITLLYQLGTVASGFGK